MSDQNSSTKWPIIPGSEYEFKGERSDGAVGVVKAVAGDVVFWSHKWRSHPIPSEVGKEFGAREWSIDSFRANFRPEDQSPIPALVAALKALLQSGLTLGNVDAAVAALALAGEPSGEEKP